MNDAEKKRKAAFAKAMLNARSRWKDTQATRLAFMHDHAEETDALDRLARHAGGI